LSAFGLGLEAAARRNPSQPAYGGSQRVDSTGIQHFLGRLIGYIPADIVGGYVVVIGFLAHPARSNTPQWIIAAFFLALTPLVVVGTYISNVSTANRKPRKWPWFRVIGSMVAYCAWVFALPASPFESIGVYGAWLRPLVMVTVTIGLTYLAPLFDREPA
jgi:hypothetical protein